jgi:hypothetical protein
MVFELEFQSAGTVHEVLDVRKITVAAASAVVGIGSSIPAHNRAKIVRKETIFGMRA